MRPHYHRKHASKLLFVLLILLLCILNEASHPCAKTETKALLLSKDQQSNVKKINIDFSLFNEGEDIFLSENEKISLYVSHVLDSRLDNVISGKRKKMFANHYRKFSNVANGNKKEILSNHGRSVLNNLKKVKKCRIPAFKHDRTKFFPDDISSLDMSFTPLMFELASREFEKRKKEDEAELSLVYSKSILFFPKLIIRATQLLINFTPATLSCVLASCSPVFREKIWFNVLGKCLAKSGPAFIKWGQWASTRSDMFPEALCEELSKLHADAPVHSWQATRTAVEKSLCIPHGSLFKVFDKFDPNPIASGSIAQIHKAKLKSPLHGDVARPYVAVKVRHPNVAQLIDMDFRIMAIVADMIDFIPWLSWLKIKSSVAQFSHTMAAQAYLNVEGYHLEVLNYNFRNWNSVGFPQPIFACPRVIIETFEEGEICTSLLDKYDKLAEECGKKSGDNIIPVPLAKFILSTGVNLYLKMLIIDNLMHADLHPGNIMLLASMVEDERNLDGIKLLKPVGGGGEDSGVSFAIGAQKTRFKLNKTRWVSTFAGSITLVDAGMVAQLDDGESQNFIGLLSSLGAGDGYAAADSVLRFSTENGLSKAEEDAFKTDMINLFELKCRGYGTCVDVGEVLRGILGVVKKHHVPIDANYVTLVVNALCIESLGKRVCPSYNVLDASEPLLTSYRNLPFSGRAQLKRRLMKLFTPLLYLKKNLFDRSFFKRIEIERRRIVQKPKVGCVLKPLVVMISMVLISITPSNLKVNCD